MHLLPQRLKNQLFFLHLTGPPSAKPIREKLSKNIHFILCINQNLHCLAKWTFFHALAHCALITDNLYTDTI